jgi:nicotinate dehydrogenase subunit B
MGAVRTGEAHLAGGVVDGWEAPPLTALTHAPLPWTEADLYDYLRTGFSSNHGVAAGPMAPVVRELAGAPDSDLRAMAVYLATPPAPGIDGATLEARAEARRVPGGSLGARLFEGACAVCHAPGGPVLFGVRPALALNSSLHSASPDNLIRVILGGIAEPARPELGAMPGFAASFDDAQVADLAGYLREVFAPGKPPWPELGARVATLRAGR